MKQTKNELYMHFVWHTRDEEALLSPTLERAVHRCVAQQALDLRCSIIAIGGTNNHMHMLVKVPTTVSASQIAHQTKGVSSHMAHEQLRAFGFGWQAGYGVFSVSPSDVPKVCRYVQRQKEHHAADRLWPEWEESFEEVEDLADAAP